MGQSFFNKKSIQLDEIGKNLFQFGKEAGKNISAGLNEIGKAVKPLADEAGKAIGQAADAIGSSEIGQAIGNTVKPIADEAGKVIGQAADTIGSSAVGQAVGKAASDTGDFIHNTFILPSAQRKEIETLQGQFQYHQEQLNQEAENLYKIRLQSVDLIQTGENLINTIARKSKEFNKPLKEIQTNIESFDYKQKIAEEQVEIVRDSVRTAGLGTIAGVAAATLAPTAAMGIATTFGVASTGTAISALSGAAATNAALAWLGGGALAAGGGGMAVGAHLISLLSGPLGWAIAGTSIIGAGMSYGLKDAKKNDEREQVIHDIIEKTNLVKKQSAEVQHLASKTDLLKDQTGALLVSLQPLQGSDFLSLPEASRYSLMSLVNDLNSLSAMINQEIS